VKVRLFLFLQNVIFFDRVLLEVIEQSHFEFSESVLKFSVQYD